MPGSFERGSVTEMAVPRTRRTAALGAVVVTRVGDTSWILRPHEALTGYTVASLRDVFLEAVDSGAQDIVVDLCEGATIGVDGAATLVAMADLMVGRNGSLWIAARTDAVGCTLRPIESDGPNALVGVSPPLDAALEQLRLVEAEDLRPQ